VRVRNRLLTNGHCSQRHYSILSNASTRYNIVTVWSDYRRGLILDTGFVDHLQVVTTNNYNIIAISTLHRITLSFSARSAFASSCLVTALTMAISLLPEKVFSGRRLPSNCLFFRVTVTLRLEIYRQSVRLGAQPLETQGYNYFFN
jgi:hypothetical protein